MLMVKLSLFQLVRQTCTLVDTTRFRWLSDLHCVYPGSTCIACTHVTQPCDGSFTYSSFAYCSFSLALPPQKENTKGENVVGFVLV